MKNKRLILLIVLVVIGLIVAASIYLYNAFEYVDKEVYVGPQSAARLNKYLALEYMLTELGVEATSSKKINLYMDDSSGNSVLFLPLESLPIHGPRFYNLKQWVKKGNLLVTGNSKYYRPSSRKITPRVARFLGLKHQTELESDEEKTELEVEVSGDVFSISYWPHSVLEPLDDKQAVLAEDKSVAYYTKQAGEGNIIVLNDFSMLENNSIDCSDHAGFIWALISKYTPETECAMVVYRTNSFSIWNWLKKNGKALFTCSIILIGSIFFKYAYLPGPRLPLSVSRRQQLLTHIKACAHFQWLNTNKKSEAFINYLRQDIKELMVRKNHHLADESDRVLVDEIFKQTQLDSHFLEQAFLTKTYSTHELVQAISTLQKLKELL